MIGKMAMYTARNRHRANVQSSPHRGFTLIELMVTIAVMAILLGIAVPSFNEVTLGGKLGSYANNFVASVNMARSEAIKRSVRITLCATADGTTCATSGGWEQGWVVKCKTTNNTTCDAAGPNWIVLHRQQALPSGLKMADSSSKLSMTFEPTGVGATSASLKVCRATPSAGGQERVIDVTATGRASVRKTTTGSCS